MVTLYKKGAGNFDAASGWNSLANGTGTNYTATDSGGGVFIVNDPTNTLDLNSLAVTLNVDCRAASIISSAAAGYMTVSGTRVINGNVTFSAATATSGMIRVGTGTSVTVNGQVNVTGTTAYGVVSSGTGAITVSNIGGTACSAGASGSRGISHAGTGNLTVTGAIAATAGATGVYITAVGATCTINGNVTSGGNASVGVNVAGNSTVNITGNVSLSAAGNASTYGLTTSGGPVTITGDVSAEYGGGAYGILAASGSTITINGNISGKGGTAGFSYALYVNAGTVNWTGSRTLATDTDCLIYLNNGVLNLATASGALNLANSGRFCIIVAAAGTFPLTYTAAGGTATIRNLTAPSQAAIIGQGVNIVQGYSSGGSFLMGVNS